MPTQAALAVVDDLAAQVEQVGAARSDEALRAQAAFVRALVDEVARHHPSESRIAALHDQLGEELSRMAELVPGQPRREAALGAHDLGLDDAVDVLVVEDDPHALRAMGATVEDFGHPCRLAEGPDEALRAFEERPASVVVTDWSMPGMSGLELCRTLKERDPRVYTILVTAHEDAGLLERVRGGWVDDFLPKPVDFDELALRLRSAVRLVRAVRAAHDVRRRLHASR